MKCRSGVSLLLFAAGCGSVGSAASASAPGPSRAATQQAPYVIRCTADRVALIPQDVPGAPHPGRDTTLSYATTTPGFVTPERVALRGVEYMSVGPLRYVHAVDLHWFADHEGVPFFRAAADDPAAPEIVYLAHAPTCVLQAYSDIRVMHANDGPRDARFIEDPLPVYVAVVKHIASEAGRPIVLGSSLMRHYMDRDGPHPDPVLQSLEALWAVGTVCRSSSDGECDATQGDLLVHLGGVIEAAPRAHVNVERQSMRPDGMIPPLLIRPDSTLVPYDFDLDVNVETLCPEGASPDCTPRLDRFSYFLASDPRGEMQVVVTWHLERR